jgi:hypothetical protein
VLREDFIERMIRQLAQAVAGILGLRKRGRLDEAEAEVLAAIAGLGRIDPRLLDASDAPRLLDASDAVTVASLVRETGQLQVLARLLAERAEIQADRIRDAEAARSRRKAVELWLEAALAGATLDADARRRIAAFVAEGGALSPRYAAAAEEVSRRGADGN